MCDTPTPPHTHTPKRILILGGDGYLGWPCANYFAARGHKVAIIDNQVRRRYDDELGTDSLLPIPSLADRLDLTSGRSIFDVDVAQDPILLELIIKDFKPGVIIHFAEQRSAPYSMIDRQHCIYTHQNNVLGTLNVLYAMRDYAPDAHLIKLGTMGEYGTPNIDIEEGFIEIEHRGRRDVLPFPKQAGSWYHWTKVHDSNNIMFACKIWGLKATDLNQGVVYGAETDECPADSPMCTRYDYDHVFGTVLNRFCVQAAIGMPLTVYGHGGQTRGYLDIRDTMRCIELAIENPPPQEPRNNTEAHGKDQGNIRVNPCSSVASPIPPQEPRNNTEA
ncbi:MAG: NAD-dependent epimerase/dehydratase family protein, partial [Planctomycetota bacterium]